MPIIEGAMQYIHDDNIVDSAVNEVQTMTISAAAGSTFKLKLGYETSGTITWSSTDNTLTGAVQTALNAMGGIGANGAVVSGAGGILTSGVGTMTITFSGGSVVGAPVSLLTVTDASLTGASATVTLAKTTTGVVASLRGAAPGALAVRRTGGASTLFINNGTALSPIWVVVGSQS